MPSYRKAVNNMCRQCIYDPAQKGAWMEQVTECTDIGCSLYDVRPITTSGRVDVKHVVKYQRKRQKG